MKSRIKSIGGLVFSLVVLLAACEKNTDDSNIVVFKANGDINAKMNEFREILGVQLNTAPGAVGGHREINWDGVPPELVNKALPGDFFNPTGAGALASRQRGLIYGSPSGEFRVSTTNFAEVNAGAANQFSVFSGDKSFANISSSLWDSEFQVAGQDVAATVKGFGAVFADVDLDNTTFLEFFHDDKSLGKYYVPAKSGGSNFSFLGVYFKNEKVTRVSVGHDGKLNEGQNDISNGGTRDLVVLDDFLYDEPIKK